MKKLIISSMFVMFVVILSAQQVVMPEILTNKNVINENTLPDFSYAGYLFGEKKIPTSFDHTLNVLDFGAIANDDLDDSKAFIKALEKANELEGYVLIKIPEGKFNINEIIYINRSKTVIKGVGTGKSGTILHFQRPLRFVADPPEHLELKEYLIYFDKRQIEPEQGVNTLFSQYAWSGGFLWVAKKGKLYKSYNIPKYNQPINTLAKCLSGKQGMFKVEVENVSKIKVGDAYKLCWYNKEGKNGSLLKHIYNNQDVTIGQHHWDNPENPLVSQMVMVTKIEKNTVYVKAPLLHDVKPEWFCTLVEWEHIEEVGIENIAFEFPISPDWPHHCDEGNNAIYLTSLMNGWVRNVRMKNADSSVLTDDISNVTIENVYSHGEKLSHYSVAMGEVHNVLVNNLRVENRVRHPLSFNTRSTRCVYTNCIVEKDPILDQHSGLNEQNLFDNIKLYINADVHKSFNYPLFLTGGDTRWAPGHGAFNTFFNIEINFANFPEDLNKPIVLNGANQGVSARLIGVHANHPVEIDYGPNAYIEKTNGKLSISSLYEYQLNKRTRENPLEGNF